VLQRQVPCVPAGCVVSASKVVLRLRFEAAVYLIVAVCVWQDVHVDT